MSFLRDLFSKKQILSVALIEVSSESVGGAYALVSPNSATQVLYSLRLPIEAHMKEKPEAAMERTLRTLGGELVRLGAPVLLRATGSGTARQVLVAVSAPWQETTVRTEVLEEKKSFVLTEDHIQQVLLNSAHIPPGRILVDETPVGITLNGYSTDKPVGKRATRATVTVLASTIDEHATMSVANVLRSLFHTKDIQLIAGSSLRYQALRKAFPHERDCLILDASGSEISTALVRNSFLVATYDMKSVVASEKRWPEEVRVALRKISEGNPLPHTILLITDGEKRLELKKMLDDTSLSTLWFSDEPPTIIAVQPSHVSALVKHMGMSEPDLPLLLMGLHAKSMVEEVGA